MSKFTHTIDGTNFRILDPIAVKGFHALLRHVIGGASGSVFHMGDYMDEYENCVLLKSTHSEDMIAAGRFGCWDHTKNANHVSAGTTIIVIPNKTSQHYCEETSIGLMFTATSECYKNDGHDRVWPSEVAK